MYWLNVQVAAYGRQTVPDVGVFCDFIRLHLRIRNFCDSTIVFDCSFFLQHVSSVVCCICLISYTFFPDTHNIKLLALRADVTCVCRCFSSSRKHLFPAEQIRNHANESIFV